MDPLKLDIKTVLRSLQSFDDTRTYGLTINADNYLIITSWKLPLRRQECYGLTYKLPSGLFINDFYVPCEYIKEYFDQGKITIYAPPDLDQYTPAVGDEFMAIYSWSSCPSGSTIKLTGYDSNRNFTSNYYSWEPSFIEECLKNKLLYLINRSTAPWWTPVSTLLPPTASSRTPTDPENNGTSPICHWCKLPTIPLDTGFNMSKARWCSKCGK